jgi:hypothetical protein
MGLFNCQTKCYASYWGGIRGLKAIITANKTKETACCPLEFHLQPYKTEACQVFDESPTPELVGFFPLYNFGYFKHHGVL